LVLYFKLGRPWKVIAFHTFCMDRRICIVFICDYFPWPSKFDM
jgi:hypothetical protein